MNRVAYGNQYVNFKVQIPTSLTSHQRDLLKQFAASRGEILDVKSPDSSNGSASSASDSSSHNSSSSSSSSTTNPDSKSGAKAESTENEKTSTEQSKQNSNNSSSEGESILGKLFGKGKKSKQTAESEA